MGAEGGRWLQGPAPSPESAQAWAVAGARAEAWRHQSFQDPCWGKGRWSLGQSPMPDAPDQGATQTRVSAALSPEPHHASPPAQWPAASDSSSPEECEPCWVLSSGVFATSHRVRTLGRGPKAVVERWAPRALAALPTRRVSSLLSAGLPHDHGGWPLGLQKLLGPRHCGRADPGWGVLSRSTKLGPLGVPRECWLRRCEGGSALGMRPRDGGTKLGDPVHWPQAMGVQMGLPALS